MTRPIRILGIDPGLRRTGWGAICCEGNRLSFLGSGTVTSNDTGSLAERLLELHGGLARVLTQWRPDDAAAEQRFKEISQAHAVLSDADKRKLYDEFGEAGLREGFDADQATEDFFDTDNMENGFILTKKWPDDEKRYPPPNRATYRMPGKESRGAMRRKKAIAIGDIL